MLYFRQLTILNQVNVVNQRYNIVIKLLERNRIFHCRRLMGKFVSHSLIKF